MADSKMMEIVTKEMKALANKGLTTANLETAYKLVDIYKDLKQVEHWEHEGYSQRMIGNSMMGNSMMGYDNGNSYNDYANRGEHYVRGHYSRNGGYSQGSKYDEYMESKRNYRDDHSNASKSRLVDTAEQYMDDMLHQLEDMKRDCDCKEELEALERYINKIKNI